MTGMDRVYTKKGSKKTLQFLQSFMYFHFRPKTEKTAKKMMNVRNENIDENLLSN